jgi:hypothetical protein
MLYEVVTWLLYEQWQMLPMILLRFVLGFLILVVFPLCLCPMEWKVHILCREIQRTNETPSPTIERQWPYERKGE